jgi:hypothetical protein
MKKENSNQQAWQALLLAGCSLALCLGFFVYALWVNEENKTANALAKQRLFQIRQAQQKSASDSAALAELQSSYQAILSSRLNSPINPHKRAKMLVDIGHSLHLDEIHYEFQIPESDKESPAFVRQRMKLKLQLLHEGDLLRFIDTLDERANAMLIIRSCQLSKTTGPRLSAECEIDWIQFDETAS